MRWLFVTLLAAVACTGCVDEETYRLDGAFTEERTEADIQEVQNLTAAHGGDLAILESFPEQFIASDLGRRGCEDLKEALDPKPYLQFVGTCQEAPSGGGSY